VSGQLLARIRAAGVALKVEKGKLLVSGATTPAQDLWIIRHRAKLVAELERGEQQKEPAAKTTKPLTVERLLTRLRAIPKLIDGRTAGDRFGLLLISADFVALEAWLADARSGWKDRSRAMVRERLAAADAARGER
jgi:hypothetical protein